MSALEEVPHRIDHFLRASVDYFTGPTGDRYPISPGGEIPVKTAFEVLREFAGDSSSAGPHRTANGRLSSAHSSASGSGSASGSAAAGGGGATGWTLSWVCGLPV